MEKKHSLFEIRTKDELPVWDIIRHIVYYQLVFNNYKIQKPKSKLGRAWVILKKIFYGFRSLSTFYKIISVSASNFQFGVSRVKNPDGNYFDPYFETIKDLTPGKFFFYESIIDRSNYSSENRIFDILPLVKNLVKKFSIGYKKKRELNNFDYVKILDAIFESFNFQVINRVDIQNMLNDFRLEYSFYSWLLKFKKIKRVFVTQNGIQKALYKAAKDNNVLTYEFQHGDIVDSTILYNYGYYEFINKGNIIYPNVLYTFSNLWTKDKVIPSKCIEIGTNFINHELIEGQEKNSVTIITSNEQNEELEKLAFDLAILVPELKIYYKLHPVQFHLLEQQKEYFKDLINIIVISNEMNISDLMKISNEYVAIYSTVLFEVLQAGKIIYLYKKLNFNSFKSYFTLSNVNLIENATDIVQIRNRPVSQCLHTEIPQFFKPFNKKVFLHSLNEQKRSDTNFVNE